MTNAGLPGDEIFPCRCHVQAEWCKSSDTGDYNSMVLIVDVGCLLLVLERTYNKGDLYLFFSIFYTYFQVQRLFSATIGASFLTPLSQVKYNFHILS